MNAKAFYEEVKKRRRKRRIVRYGVSLIIAIAGFLLLSYYGGIPQAVGVFLVIWANNIDQRTK